MLSEGSCMMNIVADMHVHFYPLHCFHVLVDWATTNLRVAVGGEECVPMLVLLENTRSNFFDSLTGARVELPSGWKTRTRAAGKAVELSREDGAKLYFIAGRQIVTAERLEVLAIGARCEFPHLAPTEETILRVVDAGATPVIPWGAGKWLGMRGRIVERIMMRFGAASLWLCDSSLRPRFAPLPRQMANGMAQGFRIAAGSDPLPLRGEEKWAGRYASLWKGIHAQPDDDPVRELLKVLSDPARKPEVVGMRCHLHQVLWRLLRYEALARKGNSGGR